MARSTTTAQANALAGQRRREFFRVFVENVDGVMVDFTAYGGRSWVHSADVDIDIDAPISQATVRFGRDNGGTLSLSPTRSDSTLNRDGLGAFAPALDVGRRMYVEVAVLDPAVATSPASGDWVRLWEGTTDTVDPSGSQIVAVGRDDGSRLADAWLPGDTALVVSGAPTMSLEAAVQALIDTAIPSFGPGSDPITVYTPVPSGVEVTRFGYHREPCMDAIQRLVEAFGWSFRWLWDSVTSAFRPTLYKVNRAKTTPDATLGPKRYMRIGKLTFSRLAVRNRVTLNFTNSFAAGGPARDLVLVEDIASQFKYGGVRPIIIDEASDSPINTTAEATAMANALLADLKDPKADQEAELPLYWPAELADLIRFSANGVHYDSDQDLAIATIRHSLVADKLSTTTLGLRGTPAGAYRSWYYRARRTVEPPRALDGTITDIRRADGATTAILTFTPGVDVAEVWAAYQVVPAVRTSTDWDAVTAILAPLAAGVHSFVVPLPNDQQETLVELVPYFADGTAGVMKRITLSGLPQVPTWQYDDIETATVGTQWLKLTERGLAVASVEAQTQVAAGTFTGFAAPTRGPGDASVVKGGVLGPNEYEQDVPLGTEKGRQNFIRFRWTLANGAEITSPDFAFDAGRNPNIVSVTHVGSLFTIVGDSDVKALFIASVTRAWSTYVDGQFLTADVAAPDPSGNAGLVANGTDTFLVRVFSEPRAEVGAGYGTIPPSTSARYQDQSVTFYNGTGTGGTSGSPLATWLQVTATAPSLGHTTLPITLKATAAPSGWTVKVFVADPDTSAMVDVTASLSPAPSAPPTSATTYNYTAALPNDGKGGRAGAAQLRTVNGRAELRDGSDMVQDTRTFEVSYYA